jgi:glycosyltransferase involved in cell wall biosynthesis
MPRLFVIVPIYNRKYSLEHCFETLLAQEYPTHQYEIIAFDNNWTDGSDAVARRYTQITLLRESKQGSYAARNCGLRNANGEIVAFTDSDCLASPNWLSKIDEAMQDPHAQIVVGNSRPVEQSRATRLIGAYEENKDRYVFSRLSSGKYYGRTNNMAVSRNTFVELGPFVEWQRGADSALVQRAVDRFGSGAVRYSPGMLVRHFELESAFTYFRKTYADGRAQQFGNRIIAVKALTNLERLRVFWETVRDERLSALDSAILLAIQIVGAGCCYAGGFSGSATRQ